MSSEIKKDIKKLLLIDTILSCTSCITKSLDDIEEELEDIFCKSKKGSCELEDFFKNKICK